MKEITTQKREGNRASRAVSPEMDADTMKVARETWIIAVLGTIDLITTIVFIRNHGAEEANPIFRFFWHMGIPAFIAAKILLTGCPLLVLEWARKRNPRFVQMGMRTAIMGYVAMYGFGFLHLNGPGANEREVMAMASKISYTTEEWERENELRLQDEREALLYAYNYALKKSKALLSNTATQREKDSDVLDSSSFKFRQSSLKTRK